MMARVVPYAGVTFLSYPRYEAAAKRACETIFGDKAGEGGGEEGGSKRIAVRFIAGSARARRRRRLRTLWISCEPGTRRAER